MFKTQKCLSPAIGNSDSAGGVNKAFQPATGPKVEGVVNLGVFDDPTPINHGVKDDLEALDDRPKPDFETLPKDDRENIESDINIPSDKPESKPVATEDKPEPKIDVEPEPEPEFNLETFFKKPKAEDKPKTDEKPPARDYTIFEEGDREFLRKAPNQIFDLAKKIVLENRQLKDNLAKVPKQEELLASHPQGYVLDPAFQKETQEYQRLVFENNHWREQLNAVGNGATKVINLKGYDKNGNPVFEEVEAEAGSVQEVFHLSLSAVNQKRESIQAYQNKFKTQVANFVGKIDEYQKHFFPWEKDPAKLTAPLAEDDKTTVKDLVDVFAQQVPAVYHGSPLFKLAGNMFAALNIYGKQLALANTKIKQHELLKANQNRVEPSSSVTPKTKRVVNSKGEAKSVPVDQNEVVSMSLFDA